MVTLEQLIDGIHTCHSCVSGTVQVSWEPSLQHRITSKYRMHQRQISKPVHHFSREIRNASRSIICTLNLYNCSQWVHRQNMFNDIFFFFFFFFFKFIFFCQLNWCNVKRTIEFWAIWFWSDGKISESIPMIKGRIDRNISQWIYFLYLFIEWNRQSIKLGNKCHRCSSLIILKSIKIN